MKKTKELVDRFTSQYLTLCDIESCTKIKVPVPRTDDESDEKDTKRDSLDGNFNKFTPEESKKIYVIFIVEEWEPLPKLVKELEEKREDKLFETLRDVKMESQRQAHLFHRGIHDTDLDRL